MNQKNLEVLIPCKNRKTLSQTIQSLIEIKIIDLITVINGDNVELLPSNLTNNSKIRLINLSKYEFQKSFYLNRGIEQSVGKIILISDADIIWNLDTIEQLYSVVNSNVNYLAHVLDVKETDVENYALKRPRLIPIISKEPLKVKVISDPLSNERPGCGLICTHRQNLFNLGGYNEDLKGWGWEDQDLLIRAQILGYEIIKVGSVFHLSHSDTIRNLFGETLLITRNRNIIRSCQQIATGKLNGSLNKEQAKISITIDIELPSYLMEKN